MEMIWNDYLTSVLERANKASKTPWIIHKDSDGDIISIHSEELTGCDEQDETYNEICKMPVEKYGYGCAWDSMPNADFIAHSREDIPRLVKHCQELRSALDQYRGMAGRDTMNNKEGSRYSVADEVLNKEIE